MFLIILFIAIAIALPAPAYSDDNSRIQAVTDFLVKRAEDNAIYMFELKLKRNKLLQCNFPTTYSYIENGDLRLLLKSKAQWNNAIDKDLKTMVARFAGKHINDSLEFKKLALDFTDKYIEATQYLSVEYKGEPYMLSVSPIRPDKELRDLQYGFYNGVIELRDTLLALGKQFNQIDETCNTPDVSIDDIERLAADLKAATEKMQQWQAHVKANKKALVIDKEKLKTDCKDGADHHICKFINKPANEWLESTTSKVVAASVVAAAAGVAIKKYADKIKDAESNAEKVLIASEFLKKSRFDKVIDNPERLKRDIMFFAELADAKAGTDVEEVLLKYTLPPVTFGTKRERESHVLFSAYLTMAAGNVINSDEFTSDNKQGVYAPVGFEYSRGLSCGGSLALMLAPFDFGYPINLKLNGVDQDVDFDEIIAPSIAFSYGMKNYPISFGAAYQQGRKSLTDTATEKRAMVFFGIDLPLYSLY